MNEELQRINLDDYVQTGEGGTSLTYNHKDGKTCQSKMKNGKSSLWGAVQRAWPSLFVRSASIATS